MINLNSIKKYCSEDLSLIENYDLAIADEFDTWICHHKLGIINGVTIPIEELIAKNLYFNRPANELIFMTRSEHITLHNKTRTLSTHTKQLISDAQTLFFSNPIERAKRSKIILQFTKDGEFLREWPSSHEIERTLKFSRSAIRACCNRKTKLAYSFIWRYK